MTFTFLGIPVRIQPTFWIFLIFFTRIYESLSAESFILGGVLIMSLLVHEYGHALTAKYFGAKPEITLEAFGGYAGYQGYSMSEKQRFLITLNGPLLESTLIFLSYFLLKFHIFDSYYIRYFLYATLQLNILWCLLNLVPIEPLDGGQLLSYLLSKKMGTRGYQISKTIGLVAVAIIAPYLFYQGFFFFGMILVIYGIQSFQRHQRRIFTSRQPNEYNVLNQGLDAMKNNDLKKAKTILTRLLSSSNASVKNSATESLAEAFFKESENSKAYALLLKSDHSELKQGKWLLCKLAFLQKNYELVAKYSREIYEAHPSFETAVLNSKAFARLNKPGLAGAWLHTASLFEGVSEETLEKVMQDQSYDLIRDSKLFLQHKKAAAFKN